MTKIDIIRAWKDEGYRSALSADQLAALPANPAGPLEVRDEDLEQAGGGVSTTLTCNTWGPRCTSCIMCPDGSTWNHSCQTT